MGAVGKKLSCRNILEVGEILESDMLIVMSLMPLMCGRCWEAGEQLAHRNGGSWKAVCSS